MTSKLTLFFVSIVINFYWKNSSGNLKKLLKSLNCWSRDLKNQNLGIFAGIEELRTQIEKDPHIVDPSLTQSEVQLVLSTTQSCRSGQWSSLLYQIIKELKPKTCVELGTCLGISTAYQGMALKENNFGVLYSVEKVPEFSQVASQVIDTIQLKNHTKLVVDDITDSLNAHMHSIGPIDYAFIDVDHIGDKTIEYFDILVSHCNEGAVIVFDDIRWSQSMRKAWQVIRKRPEVSLSMDLYYQGIVVVEKKDNNPKHIFLPILLA